MSTWWTQKYEKKSFFPARNFKNLCLHPCLSGLTWHSNVGGELRKKKKFWGLKYNFLRMRKFQNLCKPSLSKRSKSHYVALVSNPENPFRGFGFWCLQRGVLSNSQKIYSFIGSPMAKNQISNLQKRNLRIWKPPSGCKIIQIQTFKTGFQNFKIRCFVWAPFAWLMIAETRTYRSWNLRRRSCFEVKQQLNRKWNCFSKFLEFF